MKKSRGSVDLSKFDASKHFNNNNNSPSNKLSNAKTIRLKKLKTLLSIDDKKILEIKGKKKKSSFHLINESDKYSQIQKNLQNTILNISIKMLKDYKFDPELTEISHKFPKKST